MPTSGIMERVFREHHQLQTLLNPPELSEASHGVFSGDEKARKLLQNFTIHKFIYHTMEIPGMTPESKAAAAVEGFETCTELKVHVAIPTKVLKESEPGTMFTGWLRYHGGGGTTGRPLAENWLLQSDYEFVLKSEKPIICIEPEYPLMPESSGAEVLATTSLCLDWLLSQLERTLCSHGIQVKVDWKSIVLFAESFGAYLAHKTWLLLIQDKIPSMWPRTVILRYPLVDFYARDTSHEAIYCGVSIPAEKAEKDCVTILQTRTDMSFVKPRSGSQPPYAMYLAFASSVSHHWSAMWNEQSVFQMIESAPNNSDVDTFFYITHGTSDQHVPHKTSQKLSKLLQEKFPKVKVNLALQNDMPHAWDYKEPLKDDYEAILFEHCT